MTEEALEVLKASVWTSVGEIVEQECYKLGIEPTPQFVRSLSQLVFDQAVSLGDDLESFARHAKRKRVSVDDVLIVCRRNDGLKEVMQDFAHSIRHTDDQEEDDDEEPTVQSSQ